MSDLNSFILFYIAITVYIILHWLCFSIWGAQFPFFGWREQRRFIAGLSKENRWLMLEKPELTHGFRGEVFKGKIWGSAAGCVTFFWLVDGDVTGQYYRNLVLSLKLSSSICTVRAVTICCQSPMPFCRHSRGDASPARLVGSMLSVGSICVVPGSGAGRVLCRAVSPAPVCPCSSVRKTPALTPGGSGVLGCPGPGRVLGNEGVGGSLSGQWVASWWT